MCIRDRYQSLDPNPNVVAVIENGVPTSFSTPRPRRRSFALAMGRICPEKGFDLALDAAKRAGVPFLLAGQVYPYAEHEAYFRDEIAPRLDRYRRWIGRVEGEHKRRLLQSALCLLAPSRVAETASLVAREALAAGTPVIAFPNGALAQTVEPGVTGYLVEDVAGMADAIARCRDIDPDACRAVARSRFSIDRMQNEYLDLYGRLAEAA
jgi:glycosyltransferase involved in cell wall biosynthesis